MSRDWSFDTRQIHAGAQPDPVTGARAVPIYQTTSYTFDSAGHADDAFALRDLETHVYTRVSNPTTAVVEERLADLEGGVAAVAVASGQAAASLALFTLARAGDHIVAAATLYGGTYNLLAYTFAEHGITVDFVTDPDDLGQWRAAIRPNTKALFAETLGNPRGNVLDTAAVAEVAHAAGVPLVVDNTVLTPYLLRPLEHGADIVVHSTTKFLSGHGTAIGGAVIDGGRFDFGADPERWPQFNTPDPSYNGLVFAEKFGELAYAIRLRTRLLRDLGPAVSPFNSFLLLHGVETLSLRVARHSANALALAEWLSDRPEVARVHYAGLPSSPWHDAAKRYLPLGAGGVLAFELTGGHDAGRGLVDRLGLFSHLANIGDVRSLVIHPASTTHAQLDPQQQLDSGVTPGLVRLSAGLEAVADLIADLEAGLHG
ncbi:O-acetylhomoserine aminocarboxypropyltransferase/cysteine synthase family protein [Nocardia sp. NBC_01327]|uniref:O-acetylhomoserine aminocarboxypropyltransferase/cysteine synthase family protein n=1 Tax=Nocardia sp. NBC_01327 TaxID=2903593 RepID=UPI002E1298E5|nr:aminotransferase class I/II-fold pyridoxal phosphate-dependent enzyme [Nocardia sp. NBC_01327]